MPEITLMQEAREFYWELRNDDVMFERLVSELCEGPCHIAVLSGKGVIDAWRRMIGARTCTDVEHVCGACVWAGVNDAPPDICHLHAFFTTPTTTLTTTTNDTRSSAGAELFSTANAAPPPLHGSRTALHAEREIAFFFDPKVCAACHMPRAARDCSNSQPLSCALAPTAPVLSARRSSLGCCWFPIPFPLPIPSWSQGRPLQDDAPQRSIAVRDHDSDAQVCRKALDNIGSAVLARFARQLQPALHFLALVSSLLSHSLHSLHSLPLTPLTPLVCTRFTALHTQVA